MFSYTSLERRVPEDHPLRAVRKLTDAVLETVSLEFDALYAGSGRPSIGPDAALLMLAAKQKGRSRRMTVGADKASDTKDFVSTVRELNVTPQVTKNDKGRASTWTAEPPASPAMPLA